MRLSAFLGAFAGRHAQSSVCDDRFSAAMVSIGQTIARQMNGLECLSDTLADGDPTPGCSRGAPSSP